MSLFAEDPSFQEEYYAREGNEPSHYELFLEEKRKERQLKEQIRKYGDEQMRVDPRMKLDEAARMPTEDFKRGYQLRMPGSRVSKPKKEKDPLASLLKAMKISGTKSGTKENPNLTETEDGHPRGCETGKPTENFSRFAATGVPRVVFT